MKFRIRRPLIWALGFLMLALLVLDAVSEPLYFRTDFDEVLEAASGSSSGESGSSASGSSSSSSGISGESIKIAAQITATVENITDSETGIKVTLTECAVEVEGSVASTGGADTAGDSSEGSSVTSPHGLVAYFDDNSAKVKNEDGSVTSEGTFAVGDIIEISGKIKPIDTPDNPGEFNSWLYYRCRGIDATVYPESCTVVGSEAGLSASLYKIRQMLYAAVDEVSESEDEAGLFKAFLFGDKSALDEDTYASFQICGIAHVLAVGGLHLTILAGFVQRGIKKFLTWLGKVLGRVGGRGRAGAAASSSNSKTGRAGAAANSDDSKPSRAGATASSNSVSKFLTNPRAVLVVSSACADLFLLLFVLMIDGSVSAWRAYIMFTVSLIAPLIRRTYDSLSALGLAGILILLHQPLYALDSSFQLSFAAMIGVSVVFPRLKNIAEELRPREANGRKKDLGFIYYRIITPLLFSLSIQLATFPVMLNNFYAFSPYGIFLNLVIIPFMAVVLISIFGAAIFVAGGAGALAGGTSAATASGASLAAGASTTAATASLAAGGTSVVVTIGRFLAGAAHYFFKILIAICDFVQDLPGASIVLGKPALWKIIFYYAVLAIVMCALERPVQEFVRNKLLKIKNPVSSGSTDLVDFEVPRRHISRRFFVVLLLVPALILFNPHGLFANDPTTSGLVPTFNFGIFSSGGATTDDGTTTEGGATTVGGTISFSTGAITLAALYVGQGDSTVVTLPDGHAIIFDAGSSSKKKVAKNVILPYLKSSAITDVDMIFLSHPDIDHINGVVTILEDPYVEVGGVAVAAECSTNSAWDEIKEACAAAGVGFYCISAGDEVSFCDGEVVATAVAPVASGTAASSSAATSSSSSSSTSKNDSSLVMKLSYKLSNDNEFTALFTGDISSEEEQKIINTGVDLSATYLKCPHHGSKYSSSENFLAAVHPLITTVSAGRGNTYGHPTAAALERIAAAGSRTYITKTQGAILTRTTSAGRINVRTWR